MLTPDPAASPVRWGIGDVIWIYVAGVVASVVGFSIGYAITGDTSDHLSATTLALGTGTQYLAWGLGFIYVSRAKGRGSLAADFGVAARDAGCAARPRGLGAADRARRARCSRWCTW